MLLSADHRAAAGNSRPHGSAPCAGLLASWHESCEQDNIAHSWAFPPPLRPPQLVASFVSPECQASPSEVGIGMGDQWICSKQ
jgi:hypothetical protein